jgi:hypothetical protein
MIRTWGHVRYALRRWSAQREDGAQRLAEEESRVTGLGMFNYAADFLRAAQQAQSFSGDDPRSPIYFLVGHSMELGFKAYLRVRKTPLSALQRKFGHNLEKLQKKAVAEGLNLDGGFSAKDLAVLHLLNAHYADKRFEYFRRGYRQLPRLPDVGSLAVRVLNAVYPHCVEDVLSRRR